jgi:hypothetical protein
MYGKYDFEQQQLKCSDNDNVSGTNRYRRLGT